jgi:hypothetical protein
MMRKKRKLLITASVVCLMLVMAWMSMGPRVEIEGRFSTQDIADLTGLGYAENRRSIKSDWSQSRHDIRQMTRVLRRFISEKVVRIDRTPDDKAVVTINRSKTIGRDLGFLFVNTNGGWKPAPPSYE